MDIDAAARRWVDVWKRAWPAADLESIAALYAPGARFTRCRFASAGPARLRRLRLRRQAEAECRFGEPIVSGDRAAVDWWAADPRSRR